MSHLIDSDVVARYLKGRAEAVSLLNALSADGLAISIITYGEIYEGIYFGANPRRQEQGFRELLREVGVLPLSRSIMKRFASVRGALRSQGLLIPDMDLLIASTAITHNLALVTGNRRHFERVPGLSLY